MSFKDILAAENGLISSKEPSPLVAKSTDTIAATSFKNSHMKH